MPPIKCAVNKNLWSIRKPFLGQIRLSSVSSGIPSECPASSDSPKSASGVCPSITAEEELRNARPVSEIPGPKALPILGIMHHFLPGGKYYKMTMLDLHKKMREEYGDVVLFPGSMGRPDLVMTYDPENFAKLYRNEGQWPHRRSFAVFEYFRKNERPDLFKGMAGLLSE